MNCRGDCHQGRRLCVTPCECGLITENSDRSDPHQETRDVVELLIDAALAVGLIAALVFVAFVAVGYWSSK